HETRGLVQRYEEIGTLLGEGPDDMDKLLEEQSELLDKNEACGCWGIDRVVERAMDALRLPPPEARTEKLSGGEKRRVALCSLLLAEPGLLLLHPQTQQ